jgi:hypothetical protein
VSKTWECPRCGTQMTSPESVCQAVCACRMFSLPAAQFAAQSAMAIAPPMETTSMVDITHRPQHGDIVAVPVDLGELLLESQG